VAASPNGRLLVGERATGNGIGMWDLPSGRLLSVLAGATENEAGPPIWTPVWSPRGDLVAIDIGGIVETWNVADPRHPSAAKRIAGQFGPVGELAFTADGRQLVAESTHNNLSLYDVGTGRITWTRTLRDGVSGDIAVAPDGATIAYSYYIGYTGHLQILDTATGTPRATTILATTRGFGYVYGGRWLVASEYLSGAQAQLYDASTLEPIGTPFPTGAAQVGQVGKSLDGAIAVNGTGTMFAETTNVDPLLWQVDPHTWLKTACKIVGRNLTGAEWRHYLPHRAYQRTCPQYPAS
jgi:WD40 repeat protein